MNYNPVFKINGTVITSPVSMSWSFADLSSSESGRSTRTGAMTKDIISQKRTLGFSWSNLSFEEAVSITKYCKKSGVAVSLTYPDIAEGKVITRQFYTGDLKSNYCTAGNSLIVKSLSCDFIEM